MPNCFACHNWTSKSTVQRVHICDACADNTKAIANIAVPWTAFLPATIHPEVAKEGFDKCFKNSRYTVLQRTVRDEQGELVHLSIKRNDRNSMHDWRDLQRIKNEILGPNEEAMELYPDERRLVDTANQYHLWCFKGMAAPFGYKSQRCVMEDVGNTGGKQRPFEKKPEDLLTEKQYNERLMEFRQKEVTLAGYRGQLKKILGDAAAIDGCQNPFRYTDERKCEVVKPEDPHLWCGFCMARLLKKLATESGVLPC